MNTPEYTETVNQGDVYVDIIPVDPNYDTVYSSGSVDTDTPGDYVITYTFMSLSPFATKTESKKVTVLSSIPVITLNGDDIVNVEPEGSYTEQGASVSVGTLSIIGSVDTAHKGSYSIIYHAQNNGYSSFKVRVVHVLGVTAAAAPASGLDINDASVVSPASGLDIDNASVVSPASGLDIDNAGASVVSPASGLDITDASVVSPASGLDINTAAILPASGLDIIDASVIAPASGLDINDASVAAPASGLDIEDIKVRLSVGPTGLSAAVVPKPASGLDINSTAVLLEAETLTLVADYVNGEPATGDGFLKIPNYDKDIITYRQRGALPKKLVESLYGRLGVLGDGQGAVGLNYFHGEDYTWTLDESELSNGKVVYERRKPIDWPSNHNFSGAPENHPIEVSEVQHDSQTGLDYFEGLFARYYLDGFWYEDHTTLGQDYQFFNPTHMDCYSRSTSKEEQPGGQFKNLDVISAKNPDVVTDLITHAWLGAGGEVFSPEYRLPAVSSPSGFIKKGPTHPTVRTPVPEGTGVNLHSAYDDSLLAGKVPTFLIEGYESCRYYQDQVDYEGWEAVFVALANYYLTDAGYPPMDTSKTVEGLGIYRELALWILTSVNSTEAVYRLIKTNTGWSHPTHDGKLKYSNDLNTLIFEGYKTHQINDGFKYSANAEKIKELLVVQAYDNPGQIAFGNWLPASFGMTAHAMISLNPGVTPVEFLRDRYSIEDFDIYNDINEVAGGGTAFLISASSETTDVPNP